MNMLVRVADPTLANYDLAGVNRALEIWKEAHEHFASERAGPLIVDSAPDKWYEIAVDASAMVECLTQHILSGGRPEIINTNPSLELQITSRGGAPSAQPPLRAVGRFIQQFFLAMNIARPGTCDLSTWEYPDLPIPARSRRASLLRAAVLDDAFCDSVTDGWPIFRSIPFGQVWAWLHADMVYEIDIAETPSQKALFGLLRICNRDQWDPDNIPMLAQAIESVLGGVKGESSVTLLCQRLEQVIGAPVKDKKWFKKFYEFRSRIVHGDAPVFRPGEDPFSRDPKIRRIIEEAADLEWKATAALLALLQDMAITNTHAYQFELRVKRDNR